MLVRSPESPSAVSASLSAESSPSGLGSRSASGSWSGLRRPGPGRARTQDQALAIWSGCRWGLSAGRASCQAGWERRRRCEPRQSGRACRRRQSCLHRCRRESSRGRGQSRRTAGCLRWWRRRSCLPSSCRLSSPLQSSPGESRAHSLGRWGRLRGRPRY